MGRRATAETRCERIAKLVTAAFIRHYMADCELTVGEFAREFGIPVREVRRILREGK